MSMTVAGDTVTAVHLRGRKNEGKPIDMFGRRWTVGQLREADGQVFVVLHAIPHADRPIMCSGCGSFRLDRVERDDPYYCEDCGLMGPTRGELLVSE